MNSNPKTDPVPQVLGASACDAQAWRGGVAHAHPDWLAEEVPVALVFNGISHVVMLASPGDLEDFALGFALTEGLLQSRSELYGVDVVGAAGGLEVHLQIASRAEWALKERRRSMAGRTGCGLCGTDSLSQVRRELPPLPEAARQLRLSPTALCRAQRELRGFQRLQQLTGAVHAAGWANTEGQVLMVREDVGRHNALDKLIGALQKAGMDSSQGFAAITSRASFEMVQKSLAAGIGALAAVSAPTQMAVGMARESGLLLCGFVRGDDLVAYAGLDRLDRLGAESPSL